LRANNIRYLQCVVQYHFSDQDQHLIPQLVSKMIKLEVAIINCDDNGLIILKHVTEHCHRTLKSIEFYHRNFETTNVDLTLCPNVTKLKLTFSIDYNISNGIINNIISSFPNVIHLDVLYRGPSYHISFDELARFNKLQSIKLSVYSSSRSSKSCDSLLLSLLTPCPHLNYVFINGFEQISCSTLDAIIEIAKTRPIIDFVIDLWKNEPDNKMIDGVKDSSSVSKYYTSLSQSEDKIPQNLLVNM
jgi:hypothetical protein